MEPEMAAAAADVGRQFFISGHILHLNLILRHIVLKANRTICPIYTGVGDDYEITNPRPERGPGFEADTLVAAAAMRSVFVFQV